MRAVLSHARLIGPGRRSPPGWAGLDHTAVLAAEPSDTTGSTAVSARRRPPPGVPRERPVGERQPPTRGGCASSASAATGRGSGGEDPGRLAQQTWSEHRVVRGTPGAGEHVKAILGGRVAPDSARRADREPGRGVVVGARKVTGRPVACRRRPAGRTGGLDLPADDWQSATSQSPCARGPRTGVRPEERPSARGRAVGAVGRAADRDDGAGRGGPAESPVLVDDQLVGLGRRDGGRVRHVRLRLRGRARRAGLPSRRDAAHPRRPATSWNIPDGVHRSRGSVAAQVRPRPAHLELAQRPPRHLRLPLQETTAGKGRRATRRDRVRVLDGGGGPGVLAPDPHPVSPRSARGHRGALSPVRQEDLHHRLHRSEHAHPRPPVLVARRMAGSRRARGWPGGPAVGRARPRRQVETGRLELPPASDPVRCRRPGRTGVGVLRPAARDRLLGRRRLPAGRRRTDARLRVADEGRRGRAPRPGLLHPVR